MTALAASARSVNPIAAQQIPVSRQGFATDPTSAAVDAFAAMATTPSLNWQRQLIARRFLAAFAGLDEWQQAPLAERLAARVDVRGFAAWWAITARHRVDAAYAIASRACWGTHLAGAHPAFHAAFDAQARALGFTAGQARAQWAALATLAAIGGADPAALTRVPFDAARDAWFAAVRASRADGRVPNSATTPVHGLQATLAALAVLDAPGRKSPTRPGQPIRWQALQASAPLLVATMRGYLAQVSLSLRPGSVAIADTSLRHLATYLIERHPDVQSAAAIGRTHVEGFKGWLANRPGYRGHPAPAATTIGMRLGNVRAFLDRIIEWDWPDAPLRNPVLHADAPIPDHRLPRFLDDADAAALMAAARALPDLFDRVCVETLARTGMRKGEFRLLALDAIVQIGDGHWLRTPVGKLHTDRYIPLHPNVLALLEQWIAQRPLQPRTTLMFTHQGRLMPQSRIDAAVHRAARAAGIGHVTPHQLRHTLATQAINRGMSLEAIAALLGHKSMSMTLTYAKIADRTVANEYFNVTNRIEALYAPAALPADAEGPNMRALREETTTRLLGNGHCTRPQTLGCRYETICQTCAFFATTIEFRDTLTAQRDDARQHLDTTREQVYDTILANLGDTPT